MSKTLRLPNCDEQALLDQVQVRLVERAELERFKRLLDEHHYLGSLKAVGERLHYVATDAQGQWLALLVFSAPAKHLKHRDQWIGWSAAQRHRRLSLVTNNSRFLILPERSVPNLASKVLRMTLDRLATDWQSAYGHPVLVVETFVDVAQFSGTVYSASGWSELGQTDGWGRQRRDYYVKHDQPKRLFCRPLCKNACRSLQAEDPPITPMKARAVKSFPIGKEWMYEPKWDGFRCLIFRDEENIFLQSRTGKSLTSAFPEIVAAFQTLSPKRFVLDGELAMPTENGFSFDGLVNRLRIGSARLALEARDSPAMYIAFDMLANSENLLGSPFRLRRNSSRAIL